MKLHKNDYKIRKILKDFANKSFLGKILKPYLTPVYKFINPWLPYPRDFLLRMVPPYAACCEIGVYEGVFSERILRICEPEWLYLIDPWKDKPEQYKKVYNKFAGSDAVYIFKGTSSEAESRLDNDFFDFVYIDGDHSYQGVRNDLCNYYPKVKKGGLLCGDDYNIQSVYSAVNDWVKEYQVGINITFKVKKNQFIIRRI